MSSYPWQIKWPLLVLSPELHLEDAGGRNLLTFKQKIFTLREATSVFADKSKKQLLYTLEADRVMGFGARHFIKAAAGQPIGSFENDGWNSLWRTRYFVKDAQGNVIYHVREENPWIKVIEGIAGIIDEIPLIGWVAAGAMLYFLNPTYLVADSYGHNRYRIRKQRSLFERRFLLEPIEAVPEEWEAFTQLTVMRLVQLERHRG
ncbi:hypothetical protein [uncultured Meiothermus sp.]|jgi:uncharacterized protein YxjI|uniref:hypothetical protein n=1 Tax=uncultured Meiothermus sp. TaxID=157471 RepID=UPI00260468FD|nr:hypothetical protein [uncultured Meiothermus sp.]